MNKKSKYNTISDWKKENIYAYRAALRNGWLKDICEIFGWNTRFLWTKEMCFEDAKKFQTKNEWWKASASAASAAKKNGWFEECCSHMIEILKPKNYWTLEKCKEDALKYKTIKEWRETKKSGYATASTNKWLEECSSHMQRVKKANGTWTKETCINDAKKYNSIKEWKIGSKKGAHLKALRNGWMDECCSHMPSYLKQKNYKKVPLNTYTKEMCTEDSKKYNRPSEWIKSSPILYRTAQRKGWLKECTAHMVSIDRKPRNFWTEEKCIEDAKKYNTIVEWKKSFGYTYALKKKILDKCIGHMKVKNKWTKEKCITEALKYNTIHEIRLSAPGCLESMKRNGWLSDCTRHIKK